MARSYSELQREQYGGVRCKGTLQRNKYLCSNCGPSHSPCSHSTSARSNDPVALEQRKMEVCLIGLQPIAMSAPGNASSEECNHHSPRQTNSQAHPRHLLGRRHGKVLQLMFCEKTRNAILLGIARPDHCAIVLISLSPARSGLGMLPQPYCAYCLCARTDCVSLGMGSQIDWMFPRRDIPRVSLRWSRVASSCPAASPKGQYEEAKASVCRLYVARLHKTVFQGSEICRLPVFAGSIETATVGLPCNVSLDGIERVKVPHERNAAIRGSPR